MVERSPQPLCIFDIQRKACPPECPNNDFAGKFTTAQQNLADRFNSTATHLNELPLSDFFSPDVYIERQRSSTGIDPATCHVLNPPNNKSQP